jgi:hypothetical protein
MKTQNLNHIKENVELFRVWVANNEHLQNSMDVLQPVIEVYNEEFPQQAIGTSNCKECLLDMLRWAISQTKEEVKKKKNEI